MRLSVSELAQAVGQSESYVRQHIHRKHLIAQKDGRSVFVLFSEASRWAHERGLSLELPPRALAMTGEETDRTARMTMLTWHAHGTKPQNLFTLIRHRRKDTLGPWACQSDEDWIAEDLGHNLQMFSCDAPLDRIRLLANQILDSGTLEINGNEFQYDLESVPRRYWAYRELRPQAEASVRSPFSRHSAEMVEYWSVSEMLQEEWEKTVEQLPHEFLRRLKRLGFPLDLRSERTGNLMIAAAADAITCDLASNRNHTLRFHVDADAVQAATHRATVWACSCGDEVFRREITVVPGPTIIELATDVDRIGFAVHRGIDGQCIDLMETNLIKEISIQMNMETGPVLKLHERLARKFAHEVNPFHHRSTIGVNFDRESLTLDRAVRQQWRYRQVRQREAAERRARNFARFRPDEFDLAVRYFIELLQGDSSQSQPIYFADPYFMDRLKGEMGAKLYLDMFAATAGQNLRILCCHGEEESSQAWWTNYPSPVVSHVQVRSFLSSCRDKDGKPKPAFHDRFMITPEREVIITHSINGWPTGGVTFATIPYNIYRGEAEWLWSLDIHQDNQSTTVTKIT